MSMAPWGLVVISSLALLVSIASLIVAWIGYRRGGVWVKVEAGRKIDKVRGDRFLISVHNRGQGKIQVEAFRFEKSPKKTVSRRWRNSLWGLGKTPGVDELPVTLDGLHSRTWEVPWSPVAELFAEEDAAERSNYLRVWIQIGAAQWRCSSWIARDFVEQRRSDRLALAS